MRRRRGARHRHAHGAAPDAASERIVIEVNRLGVQRSSPRGWVPLLSEVSFAVPRGHCAFLVGPSGVGKSLVVRSILGLLDHHDWRLSGDIVVRDRAGEHSLLEGGRHRERGYRAVRGRSMAAIFQEPTASLHPSLTVGAQLLEVVPGKDCRQRIERALQALARVGLGKERYPDVLERYPHQFSQGQRQRVCIAMALSVGGVVFADEPTASLDPESVAEVCRDLRALRDSEAIDALVVVTHQPDLIAALARPQDLFVVLGKDGLEGPAVSRVVTGLPAGGAGELHECFRLQADERRAAETPPPRRPILEVRDLCQEVGRRWFRAGTAVLQGASFTLHAGEMLGIIGVSGTGKTTLARALIRLLDETTGQILLTPTHPEEGGPAPPHDLIQIQPAGNEMDTSQMRRHRRHIQYISQEAATIFNPGMRIAELLAETLDLDSAERAWGEQQVQELCNRFGLANSQASMESLLDRYPTELSGGQKQRLALLRAFLRRPSVLVADEPFTGQDLWTTSEILRIMDDLRRERGVGIVLISHDHALVHRVSDRVFRLEGHRLAELPLPMKEGSDAASVPTVTA